MWPKQRMLFLWGFALLAVVVVTTQSTPRTWLADGWVAVSLAIAVAATVFYRNSRRRDERWSRGDYS
jgi:uncharacterized membrane protein SirB2